jgi:hypothetical protein
MFQLMKENPDTDIYDIMNTDINNKFEKYTS